MPLRIKKALACFQREMKELLYENTLVNLDDIICWGDSLGDMKRIITTVVNSLGKVGLRLKSENSCFPMKKLDILGH